MKAPEIAYKHLRSRGLCVYPAGRPFAVGVDPGQRDHASAWSRASIEWLTEIADYLGSADPVEIAAAALLEAQGYERSHEQLVIEGIAP